MQHCFCVRHEACDGIVIEDLEGCKNVFSYENVIEIKTKIWQSRLLSELI